MRSGHSAPCTPMVGAYGRDDAEAVRWYRRSADQGDARGQNNLGVRYRDGLGVVQDYREAVRWFRRAAEQGDAFAQDNLGWMYANGRGVQRDDAEAVRWYRRCSRPGTTPSGRPTSAFMYEHGRGIQRDDAEALRWYRRAAEQGHARGQTNLGFMYGNGRGVQRDDAEAVRWYRHAAEQGTRLRTDQPRLDVRRRPGSAAESRGSGALVPPRCRAGTRPRAEQPRRHGTRPVVGCGGIEQEAVRWYRRAAEQGHARAQNNLGVDVLRPVVGCGVNR